MNFLQIFFIISGIVIVIISYDIAKRQKFNALHFLVFLGVGFGLLIFTTFPEILNFIGNIFGLQRGADALVYISIIFLLYFVILLLKKVESNKEDTTSLIREFAIQNSPKKIISGNICFLIRVYNEEKVILEVIKEILKAGHENILVVNDGSNDDSQSVLDSFGDKIIVVKHFKNRGGGAALETGFEYLRKYGKTKYVCTFDADGQHDLKDLNKFLDVLENNQDIGVVLGSRFVEKTFSNVGFFRKIILKLGIIFTFLISNVKLTDSHNGYRVFRNSAISKLKLKMDDMSYASELIDIIANKKIKYKEVPVNILYTDYSIKKGQKTGNFINIGFKTIWYKFFR